MAFPIILGTKGGVVDTDTFIGHAVNGTLKLREHMWVRQWGVGMTWFYLYDDNIGFL